MSSKREYTPSYKRTITPQPMQLTDRDIGIVDAVYRHRVMAADQIEALLFPSSTSRGKRSICQRRLQLLFHHGFLNRIVPPLVLGEGRKPYVYAVDENGADIIANIQGIDRGDLAWRPKQNELGGRFLNHLLHIALVRIIFEILSEKRKLVLHRWLGEHELNKEPFNQMVPYILQGRKKIRIFPDGYFLMSPMTKPKNGHCFLEIDMGTESNKQWAHKIKAYDHYRESGESVTHFHTTKFRVLVVTTTEKRLRNLIKATRGASGSNRFWFTTFEHFDLWQPYKVLEPIWNLPVRSETIPLL